MGDEEDRAAILRRRQRLIALAFTGLSGIAGCEDPDPPAVPVEVAPEVEPAVESPMEPVEPPSAPEDGIVLTRAVSADEGEASAPDEVQHAEANKRRRRARPRACLSVRPMVCLSVAPRPCLSPPRRPLTFKGDGEPE